MPDRTLMLLRTLCEEGIRQRAHVRVTVVYEVKVVGRRTEEDGDAWRQARIQASRALVLLDIPHRRAPAASPTDHRRIRCVVPRHPIKIICPTSPLAISRKQGDVASRDLKITDENRGRRENRDEHVRRAIHSALCIV